MLNAVESRIVSEIESRSAEMLADLRTFVELPTGPGSGSDGIDILRGLMSARAERLGAATSLEPVDPRPDWLYEPSPRGQERAESHALVPDTVLCRRDSGSKLVGRSILIAGHLDTVHPFDSAFRSFQMSADDVRATGPGCSDMKGGLVIAIHALEALDACGVQTAWTLLLNADEETGSFGSARAIRAEAARIAGLGGHGLAVEPALPDGTMVDERAGSGQFMIRAFGKSAHVGRSFETGASAVLALAGAIQRVSALANPAQGRIVNVGPLRGGATTNSVPDLACAWGNLRFRDAAQAADLADGIHAACARSEVPGARLEAEIVIGRPAKPKTAGTAVLARVVAGVASDLDMPAQFTKTGGVCDGNLMQDAGLSTLDTLGVVGGGLHTTDEWVDLSSLPRRCAILALTILRAAAS
ncbi:MAG: M20/M25/M40 family metallo-hydrolase [Phycisphaeraceae bacterium]|nr:M20/M25/M40 family metallo-hydrolase [Phycisphaeraceae bacterium]